MTISEKINETGYCYIQQNKADKKNTSNICLYLIQWCGLETRNRNQHLRLEIPD